MKKLLSWSILRQAQEPSFGFYASKFSTQLFVGTAGADLINFPLLLNNSRASLMH